MPSSPEQRAANRRNAARSTGPRTPEGKSISCRNSFKHGLTGEGIVLMDEDVAAVEERFAAFEADLKPANGVASAITRRAAILSVRMERCVREEASRLNLRMLAAGAIEEEDRINELEDHVQAIDEEPARSVRHLKRSPEGIDWLIVAWLKLRAILLGPVPELWGQEQTARLGALLGHAPGGRSPIPTVEERPGIAKLIDVQIAKLRAERAALDLAAIARSRAGAATRAIFDPSREAELARKYEGAAERGFYRALKDVERINEEVRNAEKAEEAEASAELASSLRSPEPEPVEPESPPPSPRPEPPQMVVTGNDRIPVVHLIEPIPYDPPVRE